MRKFLALSIILIAILGVNSPLYADKIMSKVRLTDELTIKEQSSSPLAKSGHSKLYSLASDNLLYFLDSTGTEHNVLLSSSPITLDTLQFNTSAATPSQSEGLIYWDSDAKTISMYNDITGSSLQLGRENWVRVYNDTGAQLDDGSVVYISGVNASPLLPEVSLADATTYSDSRLIGVVTNDIADGAVGEVTQFGLVNNFDTSGLSVGTVYLASGGGLTNTMPTGESFVITVGYVLKSDATTGSLLVNIDTSELSVEVTDTNGFPSDQRTGTTLSFVDGTRTFSITPTGSDFHYYQDGQKYRKTVAQSVVIDNTEGLHVIYFDGSTLASLANPTASQVDTVIRTKAIVAYIYWDATNSTHYEIGDERHGISMSPSTHARLHFVNGASYMSGLAIGDFNIGNGSSNTHVQFSVASGMTADEDIIHTQAAVAVGVGLPIYYLDGADGNLRRTTKAGFSMITDVDAGTGLTGNLVYNEWTGATWQLTAVPNGDYVLCHVFATNAISGGDQTIAVIGQGYYSTLAKAEAGAANEAVSLSGDLPLEEFVLVGTVIFTTRPSYANALNAKIVQTKDGDNYINWTTEELGRGLAPTSHNNLSNLELAETGVTWGHIDDQAQTIAGAKTFSGITTLGDGSLLATSAAPTTDAMIANKKYVDDKFSGTDNYVALLNGTSGIDTANVTQAEVELLSGVSSIMDDPMTTDGDLIYENSGPDRLAIGTEGQVLQVSSGVPSWENAPAGVETYIENYNLEVNATDWSTSDATDLAVSRNTTTPLKGSGDLQIAKETTANADGDYISYSNFDIDRGDQAQILTACFRYDTSDADYEDDDLKVVAYDVDGSTELTVFAGEYIKGGAGEHCAVFQTHPTNDTISFRIEVANTDTNNYTVYFDNFIVSRQQGLIYGTPSTNWKSYTPVYVGVGTVASDFAEWRRSGDNIEIRGRFTTGTTTGDTVTITLPLGLNSETASSLAEVAGVASAQGGNIESTLASDSSNTFSLLSESAGNSFTSAVGTDIGNTKVVTYNFKSKVSGWSSNMMLSTDTSNRDIYVEAYGNGGESITQDVTDIPFSTEVEDSTLSWDGDQFTAPETGYYSVSGEAFFNSNATRFIKIYIDGVEKYVIGGFNDSASAGSIFNKQLRLIKGEVLSLRVFPTSTLSNSSSNHHISISKRQSPQTQAWPGDQINAGNSKVQAAYNGAVSIDTNGTEALEVGTDNWLKLSAGTGSNGSVIQMSNDSSTSGDGYIYKNSADDIVLQNETNSSEFEFIVNDSTSTELPVKISGDGRLQLPDRGSSSTYGSQIDFTDDSGTFAAGGYIAKDSSSNFEIKNSTASQNIKLTTSGGVVEISDGTYSGSVPFDCEWEEENDGNTSIGSITCSESRYVHACTGGPLAGGAGGLSRAFVSGGEQTCNVYMEATITDLTVTALCCQR